MDITSFFKLSYGLYVLSSCDGDKHNGMIVNTVQQVTAIPERISVTISKNSYTSKLIEKSGKFCATVLNQDVPMEVIGQFGFQSGIDKDKFEGLNTKISDNGIKYISDNVNAVFACNVIKSLDLDTHITFVGDVIQADTLSKDEPITYAYYHKVKNGTTPKDAPSYKPPQEENHGYRCKICGYIADMEQLPDDYTCPLCTQSKENFEKL